MFVPESLVMVVFVAIAAYLACFKVAQGPCEPFGAWVSTTLDDSSGGGPSARRGVRARTR